MDLFPKWTEADQLAHEARCEKNRKRRLAAMRRAEAAPKCRICGGAIIGGRCAGGSMIRCGLHLLKDSAR